MIGGFRNPLTGAMTLKAKLGIGLALLIALGIALASAYFVGLGKGKNISEVEITQYEGRVHQLEGQLRTAQAKVTTRVVTKYVTDVVYQDRIVYRNNDIIHTVIKDRPVEQTVSKGYIYAHNQSALGEPIDFNLANNQTPSGIQDSKVLGTVNQNYGTYHNVAKQLEALQTWIQDTWKVSKEVVDEATRNSN